MGPSRYRGLLERGLRGHATIKDVTMTGARVNAMPIHRLSLEVYPSPGRPAYRASTRVLAYPMTIPDSGTFK